MTRAIKAFSDKLLSAVLQEKQAGACVGENGQCCRCDGGLAYFFNCQGACIIRKGARCTTC